MRKLLLAIFCSAIVGSLFIIEAEPAPEAGRTVLEASPAEVPQPKSALACTVLEFIATEEESRSNK